VKEAGSQRASNTKLQITRDRPPLKGGLHPPAIRSLVFLVFLELGTWSFGLRRRQGHINLTSRGES
jgi:hypothetical protein